MDFNTLYQITGFISSILSGIAASIAIYLFIFKRKSVSYIFHLLLNYSFQMTLNELTAKIELLNDLTVNDKKQREKIINIFNEISGQMRGNKILIKECNDSFRKISKYAENPNELTEPIKRNIISELRENLRAIDVQKYKNIIKR